MEELTRWGWGPRAQAALAAVAPPGSTPGRVIRVDRGRATVATVAPDAVSSPDEGDLAVGDWVALDGPGAGELWPVVARAERWSALVRRSALGDQAQVVAANVDRVGVVAALSSPLNPNRIERGVVLGWDAGAVPVVILTKSDLARPDDLAGLTQRLGGIEIVVTSTVSGEGLDAVQTLARPDRTLVLIGPSGTGKSSLVNAIVGAELLEVADVRAGDQKGRHTTTARQMVPLAGGGVLVDTPGLRGLGLWDAHEGVDAAFADIAALAHRCRFADCAHDREPDCAVVAAVSSGQLDPQRLASWRKLSEELAAPPPPRRR